MDLRSPSSAPLIRSPVEPPGRHHDLQGHDATFVEQTLTSVRSFLQLRG